MISGSYSPGSVYFFRGLGKGEYAPAAKLVAADGKRVNVGNASAVAVADWNRDGRLDLVIGNIDGEVWFVPNESRSGKLVFGEKKRLVAKGNEIRVTADAGPFVADWDGDGIPDLLLGASDGSVTLYRGSGKEGAPILAEEEVLVPPLPESLSNVIEIRCDLDPGTGHLRMPSLTRPWIRTKPAVYDWNGDGKLDLLVGDLVYLKGPEPKLTVAQKKERDELDDRARRISKEMSVLNANARKQAWEEADARGPATVDADATEDVDERASEIVSKDARWRELEAQGNALWEQRKKYDAELATHGFVWVYLRTDAKGASLGRR